MSRVRQRDTLPEITVRRLLFKLGYRYRVNVGGLYGKPDVVFSKKRKAIFVHGCFWHQHKKCSRGKIPKTNLDYWEPKLARNVERDKEVRRKMKSAGWQVLIVWECELKDIAKLASKLIKFLGPPKAF